MFLVDPGILNIYLDDEDFTLVRKYVKVQCELVTGLLVGMDEMTEMFPDMRFHIKSLC